MIIPFTLRIAVVASTALMSCHGRPMVERGALATAGTATHPLAPDVIAAPGIVEPRLGEIRLAPLEAGRVEALLVAEGQRVVEGELLARLDDAPQRSAVAVAEADVQQASAMVDATASTPEDLRLAEAEVEAARTRADQSAREAARGRYLSGEGALASAESERTDATLRGDSALREVAEARLAATRRGAPRAERRLARARLEGARARLEAAHIALARREIRSPASGTVLWSRRHVGEFVSPGDGAFVVIGETEHLEVRLEVDDLDAPFVQLGARCELRGDGGEPLGTARVVRSAPSLGTRALAVERVSDRTDARIREVFVEIDRPTRLLPGDRAWGYVARYPSSTRQASR